MPDRPQTRFIFVTGGVVSALGKGIASASIGRLLVSRGFRVTLQKFDPYINVDPGTMSPFEHGGTVGDIESLPFLEALRQLQVDLGARRCMFVHLTLVPFLGHAGELKTKPTQHSVQELRRIGVQPNMLICRSEGALSRDIREKIALFASLPVEAVISARDVDSIYKVPLYFRADGLDDQILEHFGIEAGPADLTDWEALVKRADAARETVRIGMVGKYVQLSDAYLSVNEALGHAGIHNDTRVDIRWVDAEGLDREDAERQLEEGDGILI